METLYSPETARLVIFVVIFIVFTVYEVVFPRYLFNQPRRRWVHHLGLILTGSILIQLIKFFSENQGLNLQAQSGFIISGLPFWCELIVTFMVLDFVIYWQHRLFHVVPSLWSLHGVHHSDRVFDVTTALRFHPIEIALSWIIKICVALALDISVSMFIAFEIFLNGMALFNHSNIRVVHPVDWFLSLFLITPSVHRVHHCKEYGASAGNYGFSITLWDRLFASFSPPEEIKIDGFGIEGIVLPEKETLTDLLVQPFKQPEK